MKHLVTLAQKYLLRQKYRTALTFACVLLSVFVFHLLCMTAVLIRGAALGTIARDSGLWEINIQQWLAQMEHPQDAYAVLRTHPYIGAYQIFEYQSVSTDDARDSEGYLSFMTVTIGDTARDVSSLSVNSTEGDPNLSGKTEDLAFGAGSLRYDLAPDEILLPADYSEMGFREGDAVTVTVTPKRGKLSDNLPAAESFISYVTQSQPAYAAFPWFTDSPEASKSNTVICAMPLRTFLKEVHLLYATAYDDAVSGEAYSAEMRIAGFFKGGTDYYYSDGTNLQLVTAVDTVFRPAEVLPDAFAALGAAETEVQTTPVYGAGFRVAEQEPFDAAVTAVYRDLGLPADLELDLVHPVIPELVYNPTLLALEFRGMDAANTWLSTFLPISAALIVLALMLWALMRFVIDNAFEISVQERSAQFATLRVMGASRKQVAVIVFMEALFFSLTAVPLGILLAYGCKQIILLAVTQSGVPMLETSMPLLTVCSVLLAWLAVFVSAYTSSLWAARAYSPLEATRRTDLQGSKEGSRHKSAAEKQAEQQRRAKQAGDLKTPRTAKLNRKRQGFLLHYTLRNIRRTRKRFLIAVITMTIGCGVFSFGISAGAWVLMELQNRQERFAEDFLIEQKSYSADLPQIIAEQFGNDPNFADYRLQILADAVIDWDVFAEETAGLLPASVAAQHGSEEESTLQIIILPRRDYDADYAVLTGVTYDDFVASGCGMLLYSAYGTANDVDLEYPIGYTAAEAVPTVQLAYGDMIPVCGALCADDEALAASLLLPEESAGYLLQYFLLNAANLGQQAIRTEIRLALADSTVYHEGYETASEFVNTVLSQYRGEVHLEDQFAANTGLRSLAATVGGICLIALIGLWGVGICTMLNTINTGVLNRCDELMMLRMIGMSQKQMRATVSMESMVYGAMATAIGGLLGIAGCVYMMLHSAFRASPLRVFVILLTAFLVTLLVNLIIARIAARPGLRALTQRLAEGNRL